MRIRVLTVFFLIAIAGRVALAQNDSKPLILSLAECERLAFENNLSVRSAQLQLNVSEAKFGQAKRAGILPKFEIRQIIGPSPRARGHVDPVTGFPVSPDTSFGLDDLRYFTQVDLDLVQPLFTFGRLSGLSKAAAFGVEADEANLVREKEGIRLQVRRLYWGLVLGKELLALVQGMEKELTKAETKIEEKLDEGSEEVTQTDLYKIQIFRYEINKRLREARDNLELGRASLRTTLGLDPAVDFDVETQYLDPLPVELDSLAVYLEWARLSRPELLQLRAGIQARHALVRVARAEYYPQLFLGGKISYNFAKDRFDPRNPFVYNPFNYFRPGIVLGFNLNLNFLQTRDKVRVAQAEYRLLAQKENLLEHGIKLEIQKTYTEALRAQANLQDSRRALRSSDNWLRATTMTWDIGVGDVGDLIDAYKANGVMKTEHLKNIFDFNVAIARLSKVTGRDLYPKP